MPAGNYGGTQLSDEQYRNAQTIAQVGQKLGASPRDISVALMAAMTESSLRNLNYGDRDSQGLFQQRPSQGWGTVAQVTNPEYAATQFFTHLLKVPGRDAMTPQMEAQQVQRSAFSDGRNYAPFHNMADALVNSLGVGSSTSVGVVTGGNILTGGDAENIGNDTGNILAEAAPSSAGGQGWWDWLLGVIPGMDGLQAVATSIGGASSALGDIAKPFLWLSSSKHWVRIFAGAAGAVFLFMGLSMIAREVKNG